MTQYKRVGITVKSGLDDKCESVHTIRGILEEAGSSVYMDPARSDGISCAADLPQFTSQDELDLLIIIGGDGTILRTVREFDSCSVPILAINRGTIGFLTEIDFSDVAEKLPKLLSGKATTDERRLLSVKAFRDDQELFSGVALNEAVIAQGTIARIVDLRTSVNGEPLTSFHADGLIVSTPTGSTAYSLAAGGPIVHPRLNATILTPINPHSFTQKPVVIDGESSVEIEVRSKESRFSDSNVILTLDGQQYFPLEPRDRVVVKTSDQCIRFVRLQKDSFFGTLRNKLRWGERLERNITP